MTILAALPQAQQPVADIFLHGTVAPLFTSATDIRAHLNVDDTSDNALLLRYAQVAQEYIERMTCQVLTLRDVTGTAAESAAEYRLFSAPINAITHVEIVLDGNARDVSAEFFEAARHGIRILKTISGTALSLDRREVLRVRAQAGYTTAPIQLVQAVLLLTGHFYRFREESSIAAISSIPHGVAALCDQFRLRAT